MAWRKPSDLSDPAARETEKIIKGENLLPLSGVVPPPDTWGGFLVETDLGDVNTGDFLGWINTFYQPWVWSYSVDQYLFIEEPAAATTGLWVYFLKTGL